jgi:hypothetical protein
MELNASDKHHDRCRSTRLPSGWEKPLNTHTCLRTSLVWAGCVVTPRLQLWLVGLCLFALCSGYHSSHSAFHNRGRDGLVCQGGWPVTLLWRWSLFVPLAGGSPRQQVAPQATLVSGAVMAPWRRHSASTSHCTPSVGSLLCQFRSSWHTPTGHALPRCATDVPCHASREGSPHSHERNLAGWSLHCLAASLFNGHTWSGGLCIPLRVEGLQHNTALLGRWGMPGRPGLGFRLRCVQSVSVTW